MYGSLLSAMISASSDVTLCMVLRSLFAFAGLWRDDRCVIITRAADRNMQGVHDRMPVIVDPSDADVWLDAGTDPGALRALLVPAPDGVLQGVPVSRRVNSPANDGPELIEAVPEGPAAD